MLQDDVESLDGVLREAATPALASPVQDVVVDINDFIIFDRLSFISWGQAVSIQDTAEVATFDVLNIATNFYLPDTE